MRFAKQLLAALSLSCAAVASSHATVLTFEELGVQNDVFPHYTQAGFVSQGFRFSNNSDVVDLVGSGWPFGAHSGEFGALNDYGGAMTITVDGGGLFSFQDLFIKGWGNSGGSSMTITGYNAGNIVGSLSFINGSTWQDVVGNFSNIDSLVINGGTFLVDDINVNASDVPEPETLALLALSLVGMGLLRRKI